MVIVPIEVTYDLAKMLERIEELENSQSILWIVCLTICVINFALKLLDVILSYKNGR